MMFVPLSETELMKSIAAALRRVEGENTRTKSALLNVRCDLLSLRKELLWHRGRLSYHDRRKLEVFVESYQLKYDDGSTHSYLDKDGYPVSTYVLLGEQTLEIMDGINNTVVEEIQVSDLDKDTDRKADKQAEKRVGAIRDELRIAENYGREKNKEAIKNEGLMLRAQMEVEVANARISSEKDLRVRAEMETDRLHKQVATLEAELGEKNQSLVLYTSTSTKREMFMQVIMKNSSQALTLGAAAFISVIAFMTVMVLLIAH